MNSNIKRLVALAGLAAALAATTGCAGHGVPAHGGGVRFFWEQEAVGKATQGCLDQISLAALKGKRVRLIVHAIGHEGGGTGPSAPGLLEIGAASAALGPVGLVGATAEASSQSASNDYVPYAFANARDIEYLKGAITFRLLKSGVTLCDANKPGECDGTVYVLVSVFGTDKWSYGFVVWRKERLTARVTLDMMFVDAAGNGHEIDSATGEATYREDFICGIKSEGPEIAEKRE